MITKFILFENNITPQIVYHGTNVKHDFEKSGNLYNGTFFTLNPETSRNYGQYIYKAFLKPNLNLFDTNNKFHRKFLIIQFPDLYTDELFNRNINNWEPIKNTNGVLEWINKYYDGTWIYDDNQKNLLLFNPLITKILTINQL